MSEAHRPLSEMQSAPEREPSLRRLARGRRGRTTLIAALAVVAVSGVGGALKVKRNATAAAPPAAAHAMMFAAGDTTIIWGPAHLVAPASGGGNNYVQAFTVSNPVPGRAYVVSIVNGTQGAGRVTNATVTLNGVSVFTAADFASGPAALSKAVELMTADTMVVLVTGPANSAFDISVISLPDPTYMFFGPRYDSLLASGTKGDTQTVTKPTAAAAPFALHVLNGLPDGTRTGTSMAVSVNGTTVVTLGTKNAGAIVPVTLNSTNTIIATLTGSTGAKATWWVTATDTTHPTIATTLPLKNAVLPTLSVVVTGTVNDQTSSKVTVNGVVAHMATGNAFVDTVPLPVEEANTLTISATDAAGLRTDSTRVVYRDTHAPTIEVDAPLEGAVVSTSTVAVNGFVWDGDPCTCGFHGVRVAANGVQFAEDSDSDNDAEFAGSVPVVPGPNTITIVATDRAGNSVVAVRHVTRGVPPVLVVSAPADNTVTNAAQIAVTGTVTASGGLKSLTVSGVPTSVSSGSFSTNAGLVVGVNSVTVVALDSIGNQTTVSRTVTRNGPYAGWTETLPRDTAVHAPAVSTQTVTAPINAMNFLFTGASPLQTGVAAGTIKPANIAVIRGRATDKSGVPMSGVTVTVASHPEYGQTTTRASGQFDIAVNGGVPLQLNYAKNGILTAQRQVPAPWQDYITVKDVVLIPQDAAVTAVDLTQPISVAQGGVVTDSSGTRRATLFFKQGTVVTMTLPGGGQQNIPNPHVRATEYTVGSNGPSTMPANLPATSLYTYAVELSMDEAVAANATAVTFSQPVSLLVENFIGFPVGDHVPVGWYDKVLGAWVPGNDGRIIKILSVTAGKADLDVDGSGLAANAATLAALGIDTLEQKQIALNYAVGQSLSRVLMTHFSDPDLNNAPRDAIDAYARMMVAGMNDNCGKGSIILCESQALGEMIALPGTRFSLNYSSDRTPGYLSGNTVSLTATGDTLPTGVKWVDILVTVAGRTNTVRFTPVPRLQWAYEWDGKDAYGRTLQGKQPVSVTVGLVYTCSYGSPPAIALQSFGLPAGTGVSFTRTRTDCTINNTQWSSIGTWDARGEGFGGWTLNVHHAYDPGSGVIYFGTGRHATIQALGNVTSNLAGTGVRGYNTQTQATLTYLDSPTRTSIASDGSVYIADRGNNRIRKVAPDGTISTIAGTGTFGESGDGGPATSAMLKFPSSAALGPDGSIYVAEVNQGFRVRRISPSGIISTFAGTGVSGNTGDGGLATAAKLGNPIDVAVGPDGAVYIADKDFNVIRRVSPSGIISTFAGTGTASFSGDGGLATLATLKTPTGVAVGPDGSVYITDYGNFRIRRVATNGIITTVLGNGSGDFYTINDGGPGTAAGIRFPEGITVTPDGVLYVADNGHLRIRRLGKDGIVTTIAGNGLASCEITRYTPPGCVVGGSGTGGLASRAMITYPHDVRVAPDGTMIIVEDDRVRKVGRVLPGFSAGDMYVASQDGRERYRFDSLGHHLDTRDALTGALLYQFGYDAGGALITVRQRDSLLTTITRSSVGGPPTSITGPYGQVITVATDANGYLSSVRDPAGDLTSLLHRSDGLLVTLTDPKLQLHQFTYDTLGRLSSDRDPTGATQTLVRSDSVAAYTVALTSGLGRVTKFRLDMMSGGVLRNSVQGPSGLKSILYIVAADSAILQLPDNTYMEVGVAAGPQFGAQNPILRNGSIITPSGLHWSATSKSHVTLSDPTNPLTLTSRVDSLAVNGNLLVSSYSSTTRQATIVTPAGRRIVVSLDSVGRLSKTQVPGLAPFIRQYDGKSRVVQRSIGGRSVMFSYDSRGRVATFTDPRSLTTMFAYDSAGRLAKQTFPGGIFATFSYDSNGNVTAITPPGRPSHGFHTTPVDLVDKYTPPTLSIGSKPTLLAYNADRQLTRITRPDSDSIVVAYDTAARAKTLTFGRGTVTLAYSSGTGAITSATAPDGGVLGFSYDGILVKQATWTGAVAGNVSVTYNTDLRAATQLVNGANSIAYVYDKDGHPTKVGSYVMTRDSTVGLPRTAILGSLTTSYHWTDHMELDSLVANYGATPLYQTAFVRDSAGQITQLTEILQGVTTVFAYAYDSLSRLVNVTRNGSPFHSFAYDSNSNRQSITSTSGTINGSYDAQDRLLSYGTTNYTYTSNGDLRTKVTSTGTSTYTYDALGNLLTAILENGTRIDYLIDAQNRRIGKKVNGVLAKGWLYQNRLKPVAELDGTGHLVSRFVYATTTAAPSYMVRAGKTYAIISDYMGSVRLVVDSATGAVTQRIDYDEFGQVTANTNPGFQPFGFAGGLLDDDTQLTRFGVRDYDAYTGRWTAKEPLLFGGGSGNLFGYATGDPVNFVDQDGRFVLGALIGALYGGYIGAMSMMNRPDFDWNKNADEFWVRVGTDAAIGAVVGMLDPLEGFDVPAAMALGGTMNLVDNILDQNIENAFSPQCKEFDPAEAAGAFLGGVLGGGVGEGIGNLAGGAGFGKLGKGVSGGFGGLVPFAGGGDFGAWIGGLLGPH
jgi:RHS repeat-associated protein